MVWVHLGHPLIEKNFDDVSNSNLVWTKIWCILKYYNGLPLAYYAHDRCISIDNEVETLFLHLDLNIEYYEFQIINYQSIF